MPRQIFAVAELKTMLAAGAQLVDVMPADEYAQDHLPGAISIPLRQLKAQAASKLDKDRPVVVYCSDFA